jgi:1-phosphatidylinositol-4-phosphate 5-kinase
MKLDMIKPEQVFNKGKSNCFFIIDQSEKFVLKSISRRERKLFIKKMLSRYIDRILNDPRSRLVRILGVFEFKETRTNILLMENILPNSSQAYIFDIKGSSYDRSSLDTFSNFHKGSTYKDNDFKTSGMACTLAADFRSELLASLQKDIDFLRESDVMDYSLLIGIYDDYITASSRYSIFTHSSVYNVGIIDILQTYRFKKKAERGLKKIMTSEEPSSADPCSYSQRLLNFICENVIIKDIE